MKAERRALKVERDLKEESVNLQQPDLYQERLSGENSKQQQARRLKIRRGLDAAKAVKFLDTGSQNDTGGVDARAEDGDLNETNGLDASVRCMSHQISTVSVAAFNNQLCVEDRHTHNVEAVVPPLMDPYAFVQKTGA